MRGMIMSILVSLVFVMLFHYFIKAYVFMFYYYLNINKLLIKPSYLFNDVSHAMMSRTCHERN